VNVTYSNHSMQYLSADCIIPIEGATAYNSVLAVNDDGTIDGIFDKNELSGSMYEIRHYNGILCPGFVNTHCHLELSGIEGLIPEGKGLDAFVRKLESVRKSASVSNILKAIENAAYKMEQAGIIATADIANGNTSLDFKSKSRHYFHTFVEVFGSDPKYADTIFEKAMDLKKQFETHQPSDTVSITPHATYSLSEKLMMLVAIAGKDSLLSIHHQENDDENLFFEDGSGPLAARRKAFNPDLQKFQGTKKRPLESIAGQFDTFQKLLLVHNTVSGQKDISFAEQYFKNIFWCLCPNANLYIENRLPDIDLFRANGCKITLGTDSLASNHQLSILEEIKTIQNHFPHIPLTELLSWGTINGAKFLGLEHTLGSFAKGKSPGVVLIEKADIQTLKLKPETTSQLIIPAHV